MTWNDFPTRIYVAFTFEIKSLTSEVTLLDTEKVQSDISSVAETHDAIGWNQCGIPQHFLSISQPVEI